MEPAHKTQSLCSPIHTISHCIGSLATKTGRAVKVTASAIGSGVKKTTLFAFHLFTCGCFKQTQKKDYSPIYGSYGSHANQPKLSAQPNQPIHSLPTPGIQYVNFPNGRPVSLTDKVDPKTKIEQLVNANNLLLKILEGKELKILELKTSNKEKSELLNLYKDQFLSSLRS